MVAPSPLGDVKIVSLVSTFVLNTFIKIKCNFFFIVESFQMELAKTWLLEIVDILHN